MKPAARTRLALVGGLGVLAAATCGIALAAWVLPAVRQAAVVREIRRLGGAVYFAGEALDALGRNPARRKQRSTTDGPLWLARAFGQDLGGRVVAVDLSQAKIEDDDLKLLQDLPQLQEVALPPVGIDGLRDLLRTPVEYVSLGVSHRLGIEGRASLIAAIQLLAVTAARQRERIPSNP